MKEVSFTIQKKKNEKRKDRNHTVIERLMRILKILSDKELPTTQELADEFNVTRRVIQTDLNVRLQHFPIYKRDDHKYEFSYGFSLNKTIFDTDEMILLHLSLSQFSKIKNFDKIQDRLYKKLLQTQFNNPYYIKYDDIENINMDSSIVKTIEIAIKNKYTLELEIYHKKRQIEPYKITNFDGIWYLFGKDSLDEKIKTFMLSRITNVKELLNKKFNVDILKIQKVLDQTHSAWYEEGTSFAVKLKVDALIADYFKQKEILQSQKIVEEFENGDIIVLFEVTHDEDIDNIIKSWLPNIEILEPLRLRNKMKNEIKKYLERISK